MTIDFQNNFWGDKQNGFDVLYQNLKCGSTAVKELAEFFRTRSFLEEHNFNFLTKLAKKSNSPQLGTFQPIWQILRSSTEKLASVHMQTLQRLNQLIKEINKYCDEHHKKQKQIKNEEISTIEAINELKETLSALNKAKEFYYSKTLEVDKLRRENASQKDIEKAESRVNKSCTEYKNLIEKYRKAKEDFEKKFTISCQNFQKIEEDHTHHMKSYLASYTEILESGHVLMGQVYQEFRNSCDEMSTDKLLESFINTKGTGTNRPGEKLSDVPEIDLKSDAKSYTTIDSLENQSTMNNNNNNNNNNQKDHHKSFPDIHSNIATIRTPKWFLRNRKEKMKDKKGKKKDSDEESNSGSISQVFKVEPYQEHRLKDYAVDSEGYTVRPPQNDEKEDSFYSSSDSDSEEEKEKKIFVKINPLPKVSENQSSNVDQLIASATALTLAPSAIQSRRSNLSANPSPIQNDSANNMQRSVSAFSKTTRQDNNDLFDLFNDQNSKRTTTPTTFPLNNNVSNVPDNLVLSNNTSIRNNTKINDNETNNNNENNNNNLVDRYAAFNELSATSSNPSILNQSSSSTPISTTIPTTTNTTTTTNILPLPPKSSVQESVLANPLNIPPPPPPSLQQSYSSSQLSKSISSTSFGGANSFSVYKPSSSLFKSQTTISSSSNGMMSRAESIISLSSDFRMTPISCSSRDSSPLTISMSDTIPVALAFQESVGCCFKGTDENLSKVNIIGCIKIAFSAGIIQVLTSNPYLPQLMFKLKNANRLEKIIISKDLIEQVDTNNEYSTYEMNMNALQSSIKKLHDQSPNARYYNLDIVKYQVTPLLGAKNAPLQLVSYWKCDDNTTNLKIDFKYNSSAFIKSTVVPPLKNVVFSANIDSNVVQMNSQPFGKWDSLTKQATWRYNEISQTTENNGVGSIKAKFDISNGPSLPSSVYVQFTCQDTILSGLDFELIGSGYRLSLVKRQFCAGRYYCEPRIPKQ